MPVATETVTRRSVAIPSAGVILAGDLVLPTAPRGLVIFAHGSGSGRASPRNQWVAEHLVEAGLATLLFDLLTSAEAAAEARTRHLRFDIGLLATRLVGVTDWAAVTEGIRTLPVGYFGASTGAAAALVAAATRPDRVAAVVSRGGRPDLAGDYLRQVHAPTLLIVGGEDTEVLELNHQALCRMSHLTRELVIVPRATHLFEEPGALDQVVDHARRWFSHYLGG
jgi:pimeloyl-ACP methyl ester carboxylesterase